MKLAAPPPVVRCDLIRTSPFPREDHSDMTVLSSHRLLHTLVLIAALGVLARPARAELEECRLLRQPDIQGDRIVFVYGGDLWTVPRRGGVAVRVTTHEGVERAPKFSPDGK